MIICKRFVNIEYILFYSINHTLIFTNIMYEYAASSCILIVKVGTMEDDL